MPRMIIRPFEPDDVEPAAALLARRQQRDRTRLSMLASELAEKPTCASVLRSISARPLASGASATIDGVLAGFLFGEQMLFGPMDYPSKYFEPRSISMPGEGHAVTEGQDATTLYRAMYAHLSTEWVRNGFYVHTVRITPGDADLQEAWLSLGFGRGTTCATRDTGPVASPRKVAGIEIHQADTEDIDVVMRLDWDLYEHHSQSPIFWPLLQEPRRAARAHTEAALADPANAHFIAYQDGEPIAMQTFERPGFMPTTVEHAANVYLHDGIVASSARGGGIGTMLLEHSMAWARSQGDQWCTLHFASANASGAPFWLGQGFVPVEYTMSRHIDERVAYANAW